MASDNPHFNTFAIEKDTLRTKSPFLKAGTIKGEHEFESLPEKHTQVVLPDGDDEDIDRFWFVVHQGEEVLYVGNERTFAGWVQEEEGVSSAVAQRALTAIDGAAIRGADR